MDALNPVHNKASKADKINIFRSSLTRCWEGDLDSGVEKIDDAELAKIAEHGYNGIWIHQPLKDYTPSDIFPEFGTDSRRYLKLLEELVARAAKHGIRVYMYLLEPRALPREDPFWKAHPELRGQYFFQPGFNLEYYALCSSRTAVREYIYDSLQKTASRLDMDFFCITAAEDYNTCIGKLLGKSQARKIHCSDTPENRSERSCPLCSKRTGPEIISELINTIRDGIVDGNSGARLLAWDWGWRKLPWENTEERILASVKKDVIYISDFEIGGERDFPRRQSIYEYSLGYAGPSESFLRLTEIALESGRRAGAKLQVGTTHELASVPNLPLIHNLWRKLDAVKRQGISSVIATWNFGTYRTLNTYLFGQAFMSEGIISWEKFLEIAIDYLQIPQGLSGHLDSAWRSFETALAHFPYNVPMLYSGPVNYAPAYWLDPRQTSGKPMGMSCYILERGDDLESCLGEYSLDETIELFGKLVSHWKSGLSEMKRLDGKITDKSERYIEEYNTARCIYHVYASTLNIFKVFRLCRHWQDPFLHEYAHLCELELENCISLLPMLGTDPRLGKHLECDDYMFDFKSVKAKTDRLEKFLNSFKLSPVATGIFNCK